MRRIAIIPARAGSKGLKDKNIIDLCGKPLIAYSIESALNSNLFDKVVVSTDSEKYGEIAIKYGAEVMYRGEKLSGDKASTFIVIEDLLGRLKERFDYFVLLQPTSPMRTAQHITEAVDLFEKKYDEFDFLVSVKEAEHGKILVNPIDEDGSLKYFDTDFSNYKRQDITDYSPNGAIFIGKPDAYIKHKHFFGAKSVGYKMSDSDSIDIDNALDYELAKICMQKRMIEDKL
jgi:N-acylneuraminate cytidylyltransferase